MVETKGQVIGRVKALSVLNFPGHSLSFSGLSCISRVPHLGDGEINDIGCKVELGGNIPSKGIMIMQMFLMSALELSRQLPFSASLVKPSYGKVGRDSTPSAELVTLIRVLTEQSVDQQIAVTWPMDQFGHVQPVGGVNKK